MSLRIHLSVPSLVLALGTVAALSLPSASAAQMGGGHGAHGAGASAQEAEASTPAAQRPGPMMLLRMSEALELTPEQVSRLEAIRDENRPLHHGHMDDAREARTRAAEILAADDPDLAAYEAALREASEHDVQGDLVRARAHLEASRVLTPVQLQALELAARISARGGEGQGQGGMHGGGMGGPGMGGHGGHGGHGSGGGPGGG